ncbi:MAG: B12-binding domain-containing radical SAM protein [Alphaproteobacteria bacterium]|nr:B12-binding domain-containing radical SAM protein [Alphaproteobacteria bacterium]
MRKEFPPFGALYVSAAIEREGHEVAIVRISPARPSPDLADFDAVAFSVSASATFNLMLECRRTSRFSAGALLMAGGVHANLFPEQTLVDLDVDVVGVGEGEHTVVELLARAQTRDFSDVAGVLFRRGGVIFRTPPRLPSRDIDRLPFPARHLLPVDEVVMNDRMSDTDLRMAHIMLGRGCPFTCRYCASGQTKVQYRSGGEVRRELVDLIRTYDIKGFAMVGNDFVLNRRNVAEICDSIGDLGLRWAALSRVDRVDRDLLSMMGRAGCHEIEYGIESGSMRMLEAMGKGVTLDQVRRALRMSHEAGIKNKAFLVHGYPGENEESVGQTIAFLDEVGDLIGRMSLFRFVPLPGSFVYNQAKCLGIRGTPASPDWDGDWGRFHIHHNNNHWWGTPEDFEELTASYHRLREYVEARWPSRHRPDDISSDEWGERRRALARTFEYHRGTFEVVDIYGKDSLRKTVAS